jgi:uncharacterized membrane protein
VVLTGVLHVTAAVVALLLGAAVLAGRKGTRRHARLGRWYVGVMAAQLAAALLTREQDAFGPFHVLAVVSAVTLVAGVAARRCCPGRAPPAVHGHLMTWSVAGLVAAGLAQWAAAAAAGQAPWPVLGTSLAVVAVTAVALRRNPPAVRR